MKKTLPPVILSFALVLSGCTLPGIKNETIETVPTENEVTTTASGEIARAE